MTNKPLSGQVAVITGAGRGLGRGGAILLGRFGAKVSLIARTLSELEATKSLVEAEGAEAIICQVDLQDTESLIAALRRTEKELGPITHLCNNAAVLDLVTFEDTTPEIWNRTININLNAVYHATRYVYPKMVERGWGTIHNVSSAAGTKGFVKETAYCAAKYGLEGFTKALALECASKGIVVTTSSPGIRTKPTSITMEDYARLGSDKTQQWADPVVMGEAFAFLAHTRDPRICGRRFNLYTLSELVRRKQTLDLAYEDVLTTVNE